MRSATNVFHLAIPCKSLDEAQAFYVGILGCQLARRYHDRITLNFFGDQVVCHLNPEKTETNPQPYPRHFGITYHEKSDYEAFVQRLNELKVPFFEEPQTRFPKRREEHLTFMILDPSNNVLEFKYYFDPEMMY